MRADGRHSQLLTDFQNSDRLFASGSPSSIAFRESLPAHSCPKYRDVKKATSSLGAPVPRKAYGSPTALSKSSVSTSDPIGRQRSISPNQAVKASRRAAFSAASRCFFLPPNNFDSNLNGADDKPLGDHMPHDTTENRPRGAKSERSAQGYQDDQLISMSDSTNSYG